ncbi:hypothetical protein MUGA111182_04425 [Mucilaginibacter galii]|uniref:CBU-0592-like domain-containing protein n=1 Tax=Mucilaginibacter galii TaxID=2005073 RepID=A0A917J8B9_9SPHI|nr:hypothetical protein [Mucilaginibacter galii]GGI50873.1 hypothetical protein GCM10011425_20850 [Mucilaginibacter galii]
MKVSDIIASVGVIILLIGFMLNLFKKISPESKAYGLMNFIGAGLCGYSSYLISFWPFVILESIWAFVALLSLFKVPRGTGSNEL